MKRVLLPLLALFATMAAHAQYTGVTAELRLEQKQYMPAEDMQLKLRIVNRSGQPITFGQDDHWASFLITDDEGGVSAKVGDMPVKGRFTLLSGQSGTRTLNPIPYFDCRRPGRYHISGVVHIAQWNQDIPCRPVDFFVANGIAVPNFLNLPAGVASTPGATNAPPEVRFFSLIKVAYLEDVTLYFRLTDSAGRTLRVFPLARMLSFSVPEAQLDRSNNIHVLFQTGARDFSYFVMDTDGRLVTRQIREYDGHRPTLRISDDGVCFVSGGIRRYSEGDLPPLNSTTSRQ